MTRDVATRLDGLKAYKRHTNKERTNFLHYLRKKFPFSIRAIKIYYGLEFKDHF